MRKNIVKATLYSTLGLLGALASMITIMLMYLSGEFLSDHSIAIFVGSKGDGVNMNFSKYGITDLITISIRLNTRGLVSFRRYSIEARFPPSFERPWLSSICDFNRIVDVSLVSWKWYVLKPLR